MLAGLLTALGVAPVVLAPGEAEAQPYYYGPPRRYYGPPRRYYGPPRRYYRREYYRRPPPGYYRRRWRRPPRY